MNNNTFMNNHLPSKFSLILIMMGVFTIKGYSQFPMNLPTLNAGDSIIVSFHTQIDPNTNVCEVSCQAEVGIGMSTILSDDPDTGAPNDPTVTLLADEEAPIAVCNDISVNLDVMGAYSFPPADSALIVNGTTDNCGNFTATFNAATLSCANIGPNIITVTYTDDSGNSSSCTATVTVADNTPPFTQCLTQQVFLDANGMVTITPDQVAFNESDACGIDSMALSETMFTCADIGGNIVTLTVYDVNGNSAMCTANIVVTDTISPTATCPGDQTGYVGPSCSVPIPDFRGLVTTSDNCEVDTLVQSPSPGTVIVGSGFNTLVTMTATDQSGNTGTCTFNFNVLDTIPPVAICQDVTVQLNAMGVGSVFATGVNNNSTDNCGIDGLGLSQSVFDCSDVGANSVVLTVTDDAGNTSTCTATVTVQDNVPPAPNCNFLTVYLDENGEVEVDGAAVGAGSTDACGIASYTLSDSTFDCSNVGFNFVLLTVTDNNGNSAFCSSSLVVADTLDPTIICPPNDTLYFAGNCSAIVPDYRPLATADDNCPGFTLQQSVNPGTPISGHGTVQPVTLTVTDDSGNTTTCTFTVTFLDTVPPDAICMDITIQLDEQGLATISAGDVDNNSTDNCSIIGMQISQTEFTCDDFGDNTVTLTVTDIAGNTSTCSANVHVEDPFVVCCDLPVAICQDVTVNLDEDGNASIEVVDVDNGSTADCGLDSIYLNIVDFDCDDVGNVNVTLTVIDSNGNMSSCTTNVTVVDLIPPTISCPEDATIECGTTELPGPSPTAVIASDNCGIESVTWSGDVSTGTCPEVVTRTYVATDENGNSTSCVQTFTIVDTTPPSISCPEDDVIDCDEMTCLTFDESIVNPVGAPVIVSSVTDGDVTVEVSAYRKGGIEVSASIFDSDQPITEPDLGTPNVLYGGTGVSEMDPDGYNASNDQSLGNLLIIQNPLAGYPDDHILGDSLVFDFDRSVYVSGISMVDFEAEQVNSGAGVYMYDQYDVLLGFVGLNAAEAGDNSMQDLYLNTFGVRKLVVYYGSSVPSSGAIGNLCYTYVPFDAVITDLCLLGGAVVDESSEVSECSTIVRHAYWANDDCGNVTTQTCVTTIFGDYQQPDVICPDDLTIGCDDEVPAPNAGQVVATDNCSSGQGIFVTWVEDIIDGEACAEVIRRIYSATDECGNVSLCVQIITREELSPVPQIQLSARVMLGGPMESGDPEMHPMITELLPLQQPYSGAPFNYAGTESVTEFGDHIVDWILVELRDVVTMEVISRRAALVTETGDIVELDGVSPLTITATADLYYVAMCHRNHLDVLSDGPVDFMDHTGVLDLTLGNAGMIETSPGHWAMIKGDTNKDGLINNTDLVTLSPYAATGHSNEYLNLDVNMDGLVNNTDLVILSAFAAIGFTQGF